jgi:hypothetical protein
VSGNPRGRGLAKDRAREDEAARLELVAAIVRDFGRRLTAAEAALVDEFAAASVRAKRLRQGGKPADDAVRLMARLGRMLGIIDGAAAPKPPAPTLADYLQSLPPDAGDAPDEPENTGGEPARASNTPPATEAAPSAETVPASTARSPGGDPP